MPNIHRGEIAAEIGGETRTLCLTLGALAELEARLGAGDLAGLAERFAGGKISARDLTAIIGAGLRGGGTPYHRPIRKPVLGSVRVAVAGVEAMSGWSVDLTTGIVSIAVAPAAGVAVTAGFLFDVPVRFDTDRLDVEWSGFDAAEAPNIPLVEILP